MMTLLWGGLFITITFIYSLIFWIMIVGPARIKERVKQLANEGGWKPAPTPGPISNTPRNEKHVKKSTLFLRLKEKIVVMFEQDKNKSWNKRLQDQIRLAGMQVTAEELFSIMLVCFIVPVIGGFFTGSILLGIVVGMVCSCFPILYVRVQQQRRMNKFNRQLHEMLTMTSNSLKSGYSFLQAVQTIAREMPSPISDEFQRMIREVNMGLPLEESLIRLNQRVRSQDFDLITTAILIQRQIGGNLSEILDNIGETIRERVRIQGEIKSLTAQGRFSAIIFMLLPPGVTLMIHLMNPSYIGVLFEHPIGLAMIIGAVIAQLIGFMLIRNIVTIEV